MFALYPAFFTWSIMAPTPLIVMFFVNISILVYVMFSDYLNEGHPGNRPEDLLWCMTYYFVALTLISGIVPALGTEMRYVSFYRKLHPLLAFGAILFEAFRWQTCRLAVHRRIEPSERFIRQGAMTLVVVTIAGFVLFNQIRQRQLSVDYDDNTVKSVPLLRAENSTAPPIDPQRMAGSLECRECHVEAYDQWAVSVHAYTVRNVPFQRTARAIAEKHGEGVLTLCATCHDPGAALSVNPAQIIDPEYVATSEGVGCRSCHYMTVGKEKNGMYALSFPRSDRLSTDPAVRSRYIRSASLEHVANNMHPILLNGVSCFPCHSLESHRATGIQVPIDNVTSFLESSASSLYECQTCHMPHLQVDKAQYTTKDHRMFGSHYLLDLTAIETDAKQRERLKAFAEDSRLWLSSQLKTQEFPKGYIDEIFLKYRIDNVFRIARRVRGTYSIADNRSGHFQMRLTNSEVRKMADRRHVRLSFETKAPHIAHDFPSSLFANISRTWFNLVVKDVRGQVVYKEGSHEPGSSLIGRLEVFDDDTVIRPDQNLEYTKIINRRWILPDQSDQRDYEFELSDDAALPLTAEFSIQRMRYNPADREWLGLPDSLRFDPITLQAETFEIR